MQSDHQKFEESYMQRKPLRCSGKQITWESFNVKGHYNLKVI